MYALVNSDLDQILMGPVKLQDAWADTSGTLHHLKDLTDLELKALNWLPCIFVDNPGEYESIVSIDQTISSSAVTITYTNQLLDLDFIKSLKCSDAGGFRDQNIYSGVTFGTVDFDSTPESLNNLNGMVTSITAQLSISVSAPPVGWTATNNTTISFTPTEMIQFGLAVTSFVGTNYTYGRSVKNDILALSTQASAASYDVTVGWPSTDLGGSIASV